MRKTPLHELKMYIVQGFLEVWKSTVDGLVLHYEKTRTSQDVCTFLQVKVVALSCLLAALLIHR